jgi:hypothetical protein
LGRASRKGEELADGSSTLKHLKEKKSDKQQRGKRKKRDSNKKERVNSSSIIKKSPFICI